MPVKHNVISVLIRFEGCILKSFLKLFLSKACLIENKFKTFVPSLCHDGGSMIYKEEVRDRLYDPLATNFKSMRK